MPFVLPVSCVLMQSLQWAALMEGKGEKSSIQSLGPYKAIWCGQGIFQTRSNNRPKQKCAQKYQSSQHLRRVQKIQEKTTRAGKVFKNSGRFEYVGRKTILGGKKKICFFQFAGLRCQALMRASAKPEPKSTSQKLQALGSCAKPQPGDLDLQLSLTLLNAHFVSEMGKKRGGGGGSFIVVMDYFKVDLRT